MRAVLLLISVFGLGALAYWLSTGTEGQVAQAPDAPTPAMVAINVPTTLSANAQIGKAAFDAKCDVCHGANAVGRAGVAPPLVHIIYEPSHHADEAFQRAVSLGVRQHHWSFGDMPAIEGLNRGDVTMIIAYVRELQRANGIN